MSVVKSGGGGAGLLGAVVEFTEIDTVAANKLLGSIAGGTPEEIDLTAAGRAILDDASVGAILTTIGGMTNMTLVALSNATHNASHGDVVICSAGAGPPTVNLPTATAKNWVAVINTSMTAQTTTIDATENIQGTGTAHGMTNDYAAAFFVADGTEWHIAYYYDGTAPA